MGRWRKVEERQGVWEGVIKQLRSKDMKDAKTASATAK